MRTTAAKEGRRRYESPVRRKQAADTRERILGAGAALVRELRTWDWSGITMRAVAERAGVSERTVYRHFTSQELLHDAVLQRIDREAGVRYEGMALRDVSPMGSRLFTAISSFAVPPPTLTEDPALIHEDDRRRQALLAAVQQATAGWTPEEQRQAAAVLDVLSIVTSYQRVVTAWQLSPQDAVETLDWAIAVVVDAIEAGRAPQLR